MPIQNSEQDERAAEKCKLKILQNRFRGSRVSLKIKAALCWQLNRMLHRNPSISFSGRRNRFPTFPEPTGLEPATSAVTGQRSNQLS
jgi:hypothetical protein